MTGAPSSCSTASATGASRNCFPTSHGCGSRGYRGGGPQSDLLRRLVHWLMKEPDLEEETLVAGSRRRAHRDRPPQPRRDIGSRRRHRSRRRTRDAGAVRRRRRPGERRTLRRCAGAFTASSTMAIPPSPSSAWRRAKSSATCARRRRFSAPSPRRPAAASAGSPATACRTSAASAPARALAGRGWIGLADRRGSVVTGLEQTPLMPGWLFVLLALGGLLLAWPRREPLSVYPRSAARSRRAMTVAWISAAPSKMLSMRASTSTRLIGYSSA